MTINLQIY